MRKWRVWAIALMLGMTAVSVLAQQREALTFDHGYAQWDGLLKKHVRVLPGAVASQVNYRTLLAERAALGAVLQSWSAVSYAEFQRWTRDQQKAFLINAYNGWTLEWILTRYPDIQSIKDLGSVWQSAWKKKFFVLLGESRYLDWIEHEQLRQHYADPRLHAALNCASVGCPALRAEAYTSVRLEQQLEEAMRLFLSDRTRNRVRNGRLEVSSIFQWFKEDFERGDVSAYLARYAQWLTARPEEQQAIREKTLPLRYLDYDWALNDVR